MESLPFYLLYLSCPFIHKQFGSKVMHKQKIYNGPWANVGLNIYPCLQMLDLVVILRLWGEWWTQTVIWWEKLEKIPMKIYKLGLPSFPSILHLIWIWCEVGSGRLVHAMCEIPTFWYRLLVVASIFVSSLSFSFSITLLLCIYGTIRSCACINMRSIPMLIFLSRAVSFVFCTLAQIPILCYCIILPN